MDGSSDMLLGRNTVHFGQAPVHRQVTKIGIQESYTDGSVLDEMVQQCRAWGICTRGRRPVFTLCAPRQFALQFADTVTKPPILLAHRIIGRVPRAWSTHT